MAPAGQYVFAEMLGISEHFTAGSHEWLPYSDFSTFPKQCAKPQFTALLRKADKHMILSEEEHITPGHAVFVETVNANPCWLPFD